MVEEVACVSLNFKKSFIHFLTVSQTYKFYIILGKRDVSGNAFDLAAQEVPDTVIDLASLQKFLNLQTQQSNLTDND